MEKDPFEKWLKASLEEETKEIIFSAEAKEKVRKRISPRDRGRKQVLQGSQRWNRKVSFSLKAVSISLAIIFLIAVFYTRTFFYVSPEQIAQFDKKEIILREDGVPFGAVQHLIASVENLKGVGRP